MATWTAWGARGLGWSGWDTWTGPSVNNPGTCITVIHTRTHSAILRTVSQPVTIVRTATPPRVVIETCTL